MRVDLWFQDYTTISACLNSLSTPLTLDTKVMLIVLSIMAPRTDITAEYLRSILHYTPETGVFVWLPRMEKSGRGGRKGRDIGKPAGTRNLRYVQISIDGIFYVAHRLAWLWMTGQWPEEILDHVNRDGFDNRWDNLRQATCGENSANRSNHKKIGLRGAYLNKYSGRWTSVIHANGRLVHLGTFDTETEAHNVFCDQAIKIRPGKFLHLGCHCHPTTPETTPSEISQALTIGPDLDCQGT